MRTKRTLINLAYTLLSSVLMLLLGLVTRRLFVYNFGDFIPGTATVVEKLFSFFSIAEFGVGSVISYRLYEQIGRKDLEKTCKYMSMYRWAYRTIGFAIFCVAAVMAFFLPFIINGGDLKTAYTIYGLTLCSTLSSYFLATRRLMYTCTQQGYICTRIDMYFHVAVYLARIAIALWLPNYILYFGVTIFLNAMSNVIISLRYRKDFPEVVDVPVTLADFRDLGLFRDLKFYLVHRLSDAIYGTSDSMVISAVLGAGAVTPMGNYTNLSDSATNIGNKIIGSFASAIGNIVYDDTAGAGGHDRQVFWGLDLFSYLFASFVATAYFCLFQPFIILWMGEKYLLSTGFVFMFCLNEYVGWNHKMLGSYRAVLGHFDQDQWFMIASGSLNLILSFLLVGKFGLPGVVFATVVAHSIMWAGRVRVVFRNYMVGGLPHYLRNQLCRAATLALSMWGAGTLCGLLPGGILGLALRGMVVAVVPNGINLVCYGWTKDAGYLRDKAEQAARKILKK